MIQAHELRIGNYVFDALGNITQVTPINIVEQFQSNIAKSEYLKPIPLTEEWLLKFGFTKSGGYWNPSKCWHRYVFHQNGVWRPTLNLEPEGGVVPHAQVYYVHQLQNLYFALTQKELTITTETTT